MEKEFNQAKYIQEYEKEKYEHIHLRLKKGTKDIIIKHIHNNSINSYIVNLIEEDLKKA